MRSSARCLTWAGHGKEPRYLFVTSVEIDRLHLHLNNSASSTSFSVYMQDHLGRGHNWLALAPLADTSIRYWECFIMHTSWLQFLSLLSSGITWAWTMREEESEMFNGAFVVRSNPGKDKSQNSFFCFRLGSLVRPIADQSLAVWLTFCYGPISLSPSKHSFRPTKPN
jgi:hypothetical protein